MVVQTCILGNTKVTHWFLHSLDKVNWPSSSQAPRYSSPGAYFRDQKLQSAVLHINILSWMMYIRLALLR
jgi:hypothetical protein